MMGLLTAGASAAAAIVAMAHNGSTGANWAPFCQQFRSFCDRISGSLIGSFVSVVVFILIIIVTSVAISRRWLLVCVCVCVCALYKTRSWISCIWAVFVRLALAWLRKHKKRYKVWRAILLLYIFVKWSAVFKYIIFLPAGKIYTRITQC